MNFDFNKQQNNIIFTTGRKKEWINVGDILFITVELTLSSIFVQHRETPYYCVKQLKEFEIELTNHGFFRANGNTLVNGKFIRSIEKENKEHIIHLQDGRKIILSRRQYSKIRKMINSSNSGL